MNTRICILFIVGSFFLVETKAQTAEWAVRPTSAQLEGYGRLFKVKKNGKCGLIDRNSRIIIPADYDSITSFKDGYSLAMNRRGNQLKIEAVISEGDYDIQPVSEDVYLTRYAWFSEGKMPVKGNGGWGYLGTDGNMVIPCQFQQAHPFSEGFASVKIDDKAYYINKNMDYLNIEAGYGDLVFGSTFSGNEAIVYSNNMKGYVINRKGRTLRSYKVKVEQLKINKYDHSVGDKAQIFKEQVQRLDEDNSYTVYKENNLWGYKKNGKIILPAQFEVAEPVRGEYANVRHKGQSGVLRFLNGSFSLQMEQGTISINQGVTDRGRLKLSIPSALEDAGIRLKMTDSNGRELFVQANSNQGTQRTYSFQPIESPESSESVRCVVEVWNDDILLLRQSCKIDYSIAVVPDEDITSISPVEEKPKPAIRIASLSLSTPKPNSKRASPKNEFFVTVSVSNSGDERGNANVTLLVDGQQVGSKGISVRGHGTANAVFAVTGVKKERYAKVKAMLRNGKTSQEASIHFLPFY